MNRADLQKRLIEFSVNIIQLIDELPQTKSANHLAGQLIRSGISPALNYGEAQSAESRKDFVHKMQIALKELRETYICLEIINEANMIDSDILLEKILTENNELISIFVKSVETAKTNLNSKEKYNVL